METYLYIEEVLRDIRNSPDKKFTLTTPKLQEVVPQDQLKYIGINKRGHIVWNNEELVDIKNINIKWYELIDSKLPEHKPETFKFIEVLQDTSNPKIKLVKNKPEYNLICTKDLYFKPYEFLDYILIRCRPDTVVEILKEGDFYIKNKI